MNSQIGRDERQQCVFDHVTYKKANSCKTQFYGGPTSKSNLWDHGKGEKVIERYRKEETNGD